MKTILIVDDTFENLYLLRVILEEVGYVVVEAKDGKEGLEKLRECSVDLIISDILMPVMDGYMFCQACKKEESFKNIPFIFYTSTYTEALDEDFAIKLGADQFLRKPTDQNKIIAVVQDLFGKVKPDAEPAKNVKFTEEEVLKLYSKRLISKLEHKNLDLEKEVLEREKAEQLLIHKNEILDLISINTPLNEIFDRLLLNYQSVHPGYYGSISLMDEDGIHLNLSSGPSMPELYTLAIKRLVIGENAGSCGTAAFTGKTVIVSDISTDPLWVDYKDIALEHHLYACWSIPILSEHKAVIGTFAIYSKAISTPSLSDIRELNFTLNLVNIAIEKSRIVAEIKKKDESYRALIDQANDAIISYSLDGEIHDFNKSAYTSLGYTKSEFLNLRIQDFNIGGFVQNPENHERLLAGEAVIFARKFLRKDKSLLDLEVSAKLQKDGKILGIARDVTERRRAEEKLLESEYNLRQSQIVANIGSYTVDILTKIWESSAVLNKIFGINKSYLRTKKGWSDIIHPDQREEVLAYYENCVLNRKKINLEYKAVRVDDNEEIWVHVRGEFLFDDDANPIKIIGTTQDITERKKAQLKLQESEYNLRQSQIVGNIGSYAIDLKTMTWEGSLFLYTLFGIDASYAKTIESWGERIHPEDKEEIRSYLEYCIVNNKRFNKEYRVLKLDTNEEIWVHGVGELIFDTEGNPVKIIGTIQDITNRKHSEIKLQESEYSLRQSQVVANIGSYVLDLRTRSWESSPVLNSVFGIPESYAKTIESWVRIIHPDERELMFNYLENGIQNNRKFDKEYRVIKLESKEEIWVHGTGEFIYDSEGQSVKMIGTMQDVTHRKQAELKIQESEKSLLAAQEVAKIGSFNLDVKKLIGVTSITFNDIIGIDKNTIVDFDLWKSVVHPQDRSLIKENVFKSLKHKRKFDLEYRILTKNKKELKWIQGLGEVVYVNGVANSFVGTIQDITERKKAELDLKIANDFSSSLLSGMHEGLYAINLDSEIISVNPSFCKMTGFTEKELIGVKRPYPFSPPELKKENTNRYKLLIQNKNNKDYENTYMRKNGERFPVHVLVSSIYDENGVKTANFATVEDITVRRKSEVDLKLAKEFNDRLIMSMQEGLLMLDMPGRIIKVNEALCEILGYSEQELIGMELPYPFVKAEDLERMQEIEIKVAKGEAPSFQFEFVRKNGTQFTASFSAGNIKNDNGEVIAIFATVKDVSEEEKAKRLLEENAKKSLERKNVIIELASLVGTDYKEALNRITELSAKTLNVERGSVLKFNKNKTEMFCEKLYSQTNREYESGQVYSKKGNNRFFDALIENKIVSASHAISHALSTGFIEDYLIPLNIKSKLSIPIQGADEVYGVLCFEQVDTTHVWTTDEEEFATSIANLVSLMVESTERKSAENKILITNQKLTEANKELNVLRNQLEQENVYLRNELDLVFNYEEMVYGSEEFSNVLTEVEKVAPTNATVLLLGESGTGKELLARAIHNISLRNNKPLIKVNCSAIPRELIESELFGHKKGSFTGAINDKIGKFELADKGTLFLDEIGELPLDMQPKILRFLQEGEIEVVGGTTGMKKLDVRVIAATNRNLKDAIQKKEFREDLYFRLNVFPIEVPPLRDRKDDIPLLVEHFVDKFNKAYGKSIQYITDDAMSQLKAYNWPGNIRELENLIERASILSNTETLVVPGFESSTQKAKPINNKDLTLDAVQRNHIIYVLEQCNWKISGPKGAAVVLHLKPSTLRDRMTKLEISKMQ
ncbi:PAS domain S-box protein [Lacinutrix sp. MEBiC02595]